MSTPHTSPLRYPGAFPTRRAALLILLAALGSDARGEEPWTWQPRAKTILVEPVESEPGRPATEKPVRVRGRMPTGWNYVATGHRPIAPGGLFRLTVALRVDSLGPGSPPPFFKCEFVPPGPGSSPPQVHTDTYDGSRLGQWQTLTTEFRVPNGVNACWFALEKGTGDPAEIDARIGAVGLEPIARLSVFERFRLDPLPAPLQAVRGVHPRLHLNAARLAALRTAIEGSHAAIWTELRAEADRYVRRGPPAYVGDEDRSGEEQLWQRSVGNAMPYLALAYALTGEKTYLEAAQKWALASCRYASWGLKRYDGMDLATGHQLLGLALVYDWCHRDLEPAARDEIRQTLTRRASAMYQAAALGSTYWRRAYLQNHLWVNATGLAAAGFALFDEVEEAPEWVGFALDAFRSTMKALGPDGASHEGVGYWEYGVEYLLKFMDLSDTLLGVDLHDHPWWRNTSQYAIHLGLPRNAWRRDQCIVDIADCPRGHWYGPDYLLRRLAARYRDPAAQAEAAAIDEANVASTEASWLNLLWYDPAIPLQPASERPTLHHFEDMGLVASRSAWSGDESLAVFKCGPFIGHEAVERFNYDPGGGHVHPDANHFVVFGAGEWQVRDDGYHSKWTGQHNTLLVNGRGQMGEGAHWFRGSVPLAQHARPTILKALSTPRLDHLAGDAAAAYPAELGVKRFVRHLLFLKPDLLIVADDIELGQAADLELRFHPEGKLSPQAGGTFLAEGRQSVLRIEPLTPEGLQVSRDEAQRPSRSELAEIRMEAVRLSCHQPSWRNAVALSWSPRGGEPTRVSLTRDGDRWTFTTPNGLVTLDWAETRAEIGP